MKGQQSEHRSRIGSRAGLIAAALLVQAVVLATGWMITFRVVQRSFAREIEQRTIAENRELAERIAALFPDDIPENVAYGSPEWERLQRIIESDAMKKLPAGGFACLVGPDGKLLCHPDIRRSPSLRRYSFVGKDLLSGLEPGAESAPLLKSDNESGIIEFTAGDFHYVATAPLANSGLRLLVHQPVGALVKMSKRSTRWVMGVALVAAIGVLGVTGVGLHRLLGQYENVHEALNRQLHENLLVARSIQQSTLPASIPSPPGYDIAGWSRPADETGGDTFDVISLPEGEGPACSIGSVEETRRVALLLADASGHGIGPALAITQLQAMNRLAWHLGASILDVARLVNEQLYDRLPGGRFVTAVFAVLDAETHTAELFSAGQGPMFVWEARRRRAVAIEPNTYPLGIDRVLGSLETTKLTLGRGDVLCFVSDGIVEATGPDGEQFGHDRLVALIGDGEDANEIARRIGEAADRFTEGAPQNDDRTVLVVRRV